MVLNGADPHLQKLQERQSVFSKRTYNGSDKEKWQKVLIAEMMSSEESEDDKILVKSLPWRSNKVRLMLSTINFILKSLLKLKDKLKRELLVMYLYVHNPLVVFRHGHLRRAFEKDP